MGVILAQDNKLIRSLIQNTKLGNDSSYEQLYKLYVSRVYAVCLRLSADPTIAEEITKEVFVTTWKKILNLRENVTFPLWLTAISVYTVLEKFRDKKSLHKVGRGIKTGGAPYDTDNDEILLIEKAILSLPNNDRFIMVLHDIEKYTDLEVADLMSMKTEEINNRLAIIRNSLALVGGINRDEPIEGKIKLLPYNIEPLRSLWEDIFKQINIIKEKTTGKDPEKEETEESAPEKKGVLSWFKKK